MIRRVSSTVDPALLHRVKDWRDHDAWLRFMAIHDPIIRAVCRSFGLQRDQTEELRQRIWIYLARRMKTFEYDTKRSFAAWLKRVCRSRAIDLLRATAGETTHSLSFDPVASNDSTSNPDREPHRLTKAASRIEVSVRDRVDPRTWQVFRGVVLEGIAPKDVGAMHGMSYHAVFAAKKRVSRMLREEGLRYLDAEVGSEGELD